MRGKSDGFLLFVLTLMVIIVWGPGLALAFRLSVESMGRTLMPIALPILVLAVIVIVVRNHWNPW